MLFEYQKQVQRFLREQRQELVNLDDITSYINRARREIAGRSQCIRVLTPISGSIISWTVTATGANYSSSPTLTVSTPDFPSGAGAYPTGSQATAAAIVQGGGIVAIDSTYGGSGYFKPTLTITDTTGSGATATPVLSWLNQLNQGQEQYLLSDIDLSTFPGVEEAYNVRSISLLYNNYRFSLPKYSFTTYQAYVRQYPYQYQYIPTFFSQFGQGAGAWLLCFTLPSQTYQAEYDCLCLPSDLIDDQSVEAIPKPWQDAVPYFAAHLAFMELQQFNSAKALLDLYEKMAQAYSNYARVGRVVNPYGRY